eukprot:CAMPEP_0198203800 /NCGR_PEP_ID=MMETSP1445-20131203/7125_1 /TAXON_ID=36898 /ORGANISM="Pyramimonas sp., Strain CCMP2087" /LENGTH=89 /DNA_ID=CAMNT_0043875335 /DNA_START=1324 /DNA_END=1593 /DNA_ORIENTATION=-
MVTRQGVRAECLVLLRQQGNELPVDWTSHPAHRSCGQVVETAPPIMSLFSLGTGKPLYALRASQIQYADVRPPGQFVATSLRAQLRVAR